MNERLILLKHRMKAGEHWTLRQAQPIDLLPECENEGLSWPRRVARLVHRQCEAECVVIEPEEKIVFTRTVPGVPPIYSPEDWSRSDCRTDFARARTGKQHLCGLGPAAVSRATWTPESGGNYACPNGRRLMCGRFPRQRHRNHRCRAGISRPLCKTGWFAWQTGNSFHSRIRSCSPGP